MIACLRARYQSELDLVNQLMSDEVSQWRWEGLREAERIIRDQLARKGKQLRPLLALIVGETLGARLDRVCAPAASVEFYHLAALVLDDVQDNSAVRRGAPAVHTTATTSMAINIAGTIRSLAYHPIHRCETLRPGEKLGLFRELDIAATELVLGQSIDIGWHLGWYPSYAEFPYGQMIRWKTGSMFGCAAAMGARVADASAEVVDASRRLGVSLGALYQMADDYLDVFGEDRSMHRPKYEDFRGRKMSGPVILLLRTLMSAGCDEDATRVMAAFTNRVALDDWDWLVELMHEHRVGESLRGQCLGQAEALYEQIAEIGADGDQAGLRAILDLIIAPLQAPIRTPAPGHAGQVPW
jgi:octaprenyl-diphosphate synthase